MTYLAVDIGGTFIKYGLLSDQGQVQGDLQKIPTPVVEGNNHILEAVLDLVGETLDRTPIKGVAISSAGVVDSKAGKIIYAGYTIPKYTGTPLKEAIETQYHIPCSVLNDVNAAALGEYGSVYQDRGIMHMACLTLGTGVGGALILDGQLYEGLSFRAGEIGYLPIMGQNFQDLASASALVKRAEEVLGYSIDGKIFFQLLDQGNSEMLEIFDEFIDHLAQGILVIQYLMSPQIIVLGGGILNRSDWIISALDEKLTNKVVDPAFLTAKIQPAKLGEMAGMMGAFYHHIRQVEEVVDEHN